MRGNQRNGIILILAVLAAGIFTGAVTHRMQVSAEAKLTNLQEHLSGEVLRFHVRANSDSSEDQKLKLKVKGAILDYMKYRMPEDTDLDGTKQWVRRHRRELADIGQAVVYSEGFDYPVSTELGRSRFPEKTYGDVTFPAGEYEAFIVKIGAAKGRNWWCCLYPNLCFTDAVHAVVPEEGKAELRTVLTEEEYDWITSDAKVKVKWFFLPERRRTDGGNE